MNEETLSLVRLVADVEATPDERLHLFAQAEENPEIWRELAMRLIEEAHWRQAMRSRTPLLARSRSFFPVIKTIATAGAGIAAGLLLAVGIFRPAPQSMSSPISENPVNSVTNQPNPWYQGNPRMAGLPGTSNTVQAVDEAIVPGPAREKLKRLGVEVEESTVIYLVENDQGNRVAFPTRQAAFRFLNEDPNTPR